MATVEKKTASYLGVAVVEGKTAREVEEAANQWFDWNIARPVRDVQLTAGSNGFAILITYERERRVRRAPAGE